MIPDGHKNNFKTLQEAFGNGDVALMECTDRESGEAVSVICAVHREEGEFVLTPLAKMFNGNPYAELLPPTTGSDS